jgi:hypothetical protein
MKDEEVNAELILAPKEPDEHCNARNKALTQYCKKPAGWGTDHVGEGRCKLHGGNSLKGREHPGYIDGVHSKYSKLPGYLTEAYQNMLEDRDLLNMHEDIALLRAIINVEMEKLDTHSESDYWFKVLDKEYTKLSLINPEDSVAVQRGVENIGVAIHELQSEREAHKELFDMILKLKSTIDSETRRRVSLHGVIAVERVMLWGDQILNVIKEQVSDKNLQIKIAREIQKLLKGAKNEEGQ